MSLLEGIKENVKVLFEESLRELQLANPYDVEDAVRKAQLTKPFDYEEMSDDEVAQIVNRAEKVYTYKKPYLTFLAGAMFAILCTIAFIDSLSGPGGEYVWLPDFMIYVFPLMGVFVGLSLIYIAVKESKRGDQPAIILTEERLYLINKKGYVSVIERDDIQKADVTRRIKTRTKGNETYYYEYYYLKLYYKNPRYEEVVNSEFSLNNVRCHYLTILVDIQLLYT